MLPASNQGVGENIGFPDVCNTPIGTGTSPITYPNQGSNAAAVPFCPTILLSCMPAHSQSAKPLLTNGDNAGVAHSAFMQSGGNNLGNVRILLQGMPAETLANPAQGNNYNCSTDAKLVPSVTNVLMGYTPLAGAPGWAARLAEVADAPSPGWGLTLDGDLVRHARRDQAGDRAGLRAGDRILRLDARGVTWQRGAHVHAASRPLVDPRPVVARRRPDGALELVVRRISRGAVTATRRALLRAADAREVVLDLRGNPGGDVAAAVALAGLFLAGARELLRAQGPAGQLVSWSSADAPSLYAGPVRLRVDAHTASAAEVLAALLVAHERAPDPGRATAHALHTRLVDATRAADLGRWTLRHASGARLAGL